MEPDRDYADAYFNSPVVFSQLAATATADASNVIAFRAPANLRIDRIVAVTSTAYTSGDAADEIDLIVKVGGSASGLRIDSTFAALSAAGSKVESDATYPGVAVTAGQAVAVDIDVTEGGSFSLAAGKLDIFLFARLDPI